MDVIMIRNPISIKILYDGKIVRNETITTNQFREYMHELCKGDEEMLQGLRQSARLIKTNEFRFKDVKW